MLKVALVGLGRQSCAVHLPAISASKYARLAAVCDIDTEKAERIGREMNVPSFTSVDQLLEVQEFDFAVLCTPHYTHFEIASRLAKKGIHLLKEKPFGMSVAEAIATIEAFKASNSIVTTFTPRRYSSLYRAVPDLIPSLGNLFWIEMRYTLHVPDIGCGWRASRNLAGGGCIIDMGYHMIDLLIWLVGLPSTVHASLSFSAVPDALYDVEDSAHISFAYKDGCIGSCLLSRRCHPKSECVRLFGTKRMLEITPEQLLLKDQDGEPVLTRTTVERYNHIDEFVQSLHSNSVSSTLFNHLPHTAFVEACYDSWDKRRPTSPPVFLPGLS